jgi:hypothetical protein
MSVRFSLLALFLMAASLRGAEVLTLKGDVVKGELVSVSDKEIVLLQEGKRVNQPLADVLKIDLREVGKVPGGTSYSRIELTDGTTLNGSKLTIKGKTATFTLLAGPVVELPLNTVANVLLKAEVAANQKDWKERTKAKRGKDVMVVSDAGKPRNLDCTLGDGTAAGDGIEYAIRIGEATRSGTRKFADLHGLIFKSALPGGAPPVACKLFDTSEDVVMVSSVGLKEGNVSVTTPAGARITFKAENVARLDYSSGRRDYLSDLDPVNVKRSSPLDEEGNEQQHIYKDSNIGNPDLGDISLGGVTYKKGLTLRPQVELTYDLKGQYVEFSAVIGIDDKVPTAEGPVELIIEGDGRVLKTVKFSDRDARKFEAVKLNIRNVERLRIQVKSGGRIDNIKHMALGDAKVSK